MHLSLTNAKPNAQVFSNQRHEHDKWPCTQQQVRHLDFPVPIALSPSLSLHFQPPTNHSQTWDHRLAFVPSLLTHRLHFLVLCHTFMWDDADARYNASTLLVTFLNLVALARAASSDPRPSACHNGSSCLHAARTAGI